MNESMTLRLLRSHWRRGQFILYYYTLLAQVSIPPICNLACELNWVQNLWGGGEGGAFTFYNLDILYTPLNKNMSNANVSFHNQRFWCNIILFFMKKHMYTFALATTVHSSTDKDNWISSPTPAKSRSESSPSSSNWMSTASPRSSASFS